MPSPFARALATGRPLVMDAAMATRLGPLGTANVCELNLSQPDRVWDLHRRDIAAGAEVLGTNTFAVLALDDWAQAAARGVGLARRAAGPRRTVLGSIGPVGSLAQRPHLARALVAEGVDGLLLETFTGPDALETIRALRPIDVPILVSLWRWDDAAATARALESEGAAALGCNCQVGMAPMLAWAGQVAGATGLPLLVQPSAYLPGEPPVSPETFARAVPALWEFGVRLFGGCCGTTEAHVKALRGAVDCLGPAFMM